MPDLEKIAKVLRFPTTELIATDDEANFYQEGRRVLECTVVGLTWETPAKAPQKKSPTAEVPTKVPPSAKSPAEAWMNIK